MEMGICLPKHATNVFTPCNRCLITIKTILVRRCLHFSFLSSKTMGSDVSRPIGYDAIKKRGGFFSFGSSQKNEMYNSILSVLICLTFIVKIVLRGMKGVGKTSLFNVFQGKPCPEEYVPSQKINTTHVFWTNPTTKERVKVWHICGFWWQVDWNLGCNGQSEYQWEGSSSVRDGCGYVAYLTFKVLEIASKNGVQSGSFTFGMFCRKNGHYDIEGVDDCNSSVYQGCHCCIFIVDPRNVGIVFLHVMLDWIDWVLQTACS